MLDEYPGIPEERPERLLGSGKTFGRGSFATVTVTPRTIDYVNALIERSGDYDRALKENPKAALEAYSDLVKAKGALIEYIASLMDLAGNPNLNKQRTKQVRFS